MALMHALHLLSSPYSFPSYFWESSRQVLSCYSFTPSLLTNGQLPINELNKCSLGTYYVPGTGPVAWTMPDRHSSSNERPRPQCWRAPQAVGTWRARLGVGMDSWVLTAASPQRPMNNATLPSGSFGWSLWWVSPERQKWLLTFL